MDIAHRHVGGAWLFIARELLPQLLVTRYEVTGLEGIFGPSLPMAYRNCSCTAATLSLLSFISLIESPSVYPMYRHIFPLFSVPVPEATETFIQPSHTLHNFT